MSFKIVLVISFEVVFMVRTARAFGHTSHASCICRTVAVLHFEIQEIAWVVLIICR